MKTPLKQNDSDDLGFSSHIFPLNHVWNKTTLLLHMVKKQIRSKIHKIDYYTVVSFL